MSNIDSYKDFTIGMTVNLLIAEVFLLGKTSDFLNISSNNNQEILGKFLILITGNAMLFVGINLLLKTFLPKQQISYYLMLSYVIVPAFILILYAIIEYLGTGSLIPSIVLTVIWSILFSLFIGLKVRDKLNSFKSLCFFISFLNYFFIGCFLLYLNKDESLFFNYFVDEFSKFLGSVFLSSIPNLVILITLLLLIKKKPNWFK